VRSTTNRPLKLAARPMLAPSPRSSSRWSQDDRASKRSQIKPGMQVKVIEKHNQHSGLLTVGVLQCILTKSTFHPDGKK
jgi:uncharacterized repeat protein (TIGR03833 family)